MKLDMAGIKEGFEPVPANTYICEVTSCEDGETSAESPKYPNQPKLTYELTIIEGEYKGRKFFYTCVLHPDLLGNLKALGRCSGQFTEEEMESTWDLAEDGREFIGTQLKAKVITKLYNGEMTNNVKKIMPVSEDDMSEASLLP